MLKKFLGIFKRDKSVFSEEELKWQAKIGMRIAKILSVIQSIIGILMSIFLLKKGTVYLFENKVFSNSYVNGVFAIVIWVAPVVIYFIISENIIDKMEKTFRFEEICIQLKEEQRKECLCCIKEQDFSKLEMNWPMIDGLFQKFLECGMIQIETTDEGDVNISISVPTRDTDPLFIKHEELLTYFDFNQED